jgi:RNA polymerase sigma factor (sigma-70 family)
LSRFPETRHTLVRRLADCGSDDDWRRFLADYWRPVCRFAARWGKLRLNDAEDVASVTFVAVWEGRLLQRWSEAPQSRLRTLLCSVVRRVLSNRARVVSGRERIQLEDRHELLRLGTVAADESAPDVDQQDAFYAAWAEELLQTCLNELQQEYLHSGRGDYFRVLYGKVCEDLGNAEIAAALRRNVTDIENYYKRSRDHLRNRLQTALAEHVRRYCAEDVEGEVRREWERLKSFLQDCGGLERAVRNSFELADETAARESASRTAILRLLKRPLHGEPGTSC